MANRPTTDAMTQAIGTAVADKAAQDELNPAISGTSANTNAIQLLNRTVSDPPTQSEMQAVANKIDELINALRR